MEYLTSTCKVLYDQNTLDNYNDKYIFYKNVEEVEILVEEFKRDLSNILQLDEPPLLQPGERGWISDYQIKPKDISCIFYDKLKISIDKLTKKSNTRLNEYMVEMLLNIIIATLENHTDNETNCFRGYIHVNIYNNLIKVKIENLINTVLFGQGPYTDGDFPLGLLYKKSRFKCISCGINYSIDYDDDITGDGEKYCINCDPN
ncbi:MAG: hypothetical protein CMF82_00265 [Candidatus Marinimicrobia bacterium]|nr:hypothetical protein [Candidatus Neomarinimicrobiota bacterium]|tara:strand:+ start:14563 stop:15171 length:609 start_codon:yes stop_codon:yes gene_type:complete